MATRHVRESLARQPKDFSPFPPRNGLLCRISLSSAEIADCQRQESPVSRRQIRGRQNAARRVVIRRCLPNSRLSRCLRRLVAPDCEANRGNGPLAAQVLRGAGWELASEEG